MGTLVLWVMPRLLKHKAIQYVHDQFRGPSEPGLSRILRICGPTLTAVDCRLVHCLMSAAGSAEAAQRVSPLRSLVGLEPLTLVRVVFLFQE